MNPVPVPHIYKIKHLVMHCLDKSMLSLWCTEAVISACCTSSSALTTCKSVGEGRFLFQHNYALRTAHLISVNECHECSTWYMEKNISHSKIFFKLIGEQFRMKHSTIFSMYNSQFPLQSKNKKTLLCSRIHTRKKRRCWWLNIQQRSLVKTPNITLL